MLSTLQQQAIQQVCDNIAYDFVHQGNYDLDSAVDIAFFTLDVVFPRLCLGDTVTRRLAKNSIGGLPRCLSGPIQPDISVNLDSVFDDINRMIDQ